MRLLRSYVRTADRPHWCECCHHDIMPGDRYEGFVYACGKGRIVVIKQHCEPPCEPEDDPFDDEDFEECEDSEILRMPQTVIRPISKAA